MKLRRRVRAYLNRNGYINTKAKTRELFYSGVNDLKLLDAIEIGDIEFIKKKIHANPEYIDADAWCGGSFLHYAAEYGPLDSVKSLVALGFNVNHPDPDYGNTPLQAAAGSDCSKNFKFLLTQGAVIDLSDVHKSPLIAAIQSKNIEIVKLILGSKIDKGEENGFLEALRFSVTYEQKSYSELLLDHLTLDDAKARKKLLKRMKRKTFRFPYNLIYFLPG